MEKHREEHFTKKLDECLDKLNNFMDSLEREKKETEIIMENIVIKKLGNSAHIPIPKKYEGFKAKVIIFKKS